MNKNNISVTINFVPVIAAVLAINKAIDAGDPQVTFKRLLAPTAHILDLDEHNEEKYQSSLATQKSNKADVRANGSSCGLLFVVGC